MGLVIPILVFFMGTGGSAGAEEDPLKAHLLRIAGSEAFRAAHLGIAIESVRTGNPVFVLHGEKRFLPASNMKLYTSAAALLALGLDFTYRTVVMTDGAVESGTLRGNIIIRASGDPTISGYFHNNNPLAIFEDWADAFLRKGITKVEGDIIVDNSLFHDSPLGAGWHWDDTDQCYSAPKDAFSYNNNCLALTVTPGRKTGDAALFELEPRTTYFTILNRATTGIPGSGVRIEATSGEDGRTITLSGSIPAQGQNVIRYLAVRHPAEFGAFVLRETLKSKGISVKGRLACLRGSCEGNGSKNGEKAIGQTGTILAVYRSPKLSEILKVINGLSNNLYAESVLLTIAAQAGREVNTREAVIVVREVFEKAGIELTDLHMADGSGLSRYNLITPGDTVRLLSGMARNPQFKVFLGSLATPGHEGTLRNWPKEKDIDDPVRAKTGTMKHIRNLSGYVTTKGGEILAFSLLCNNFNTSNATIDKLYGNILSAIIDLQGTR